MLIYKSFLSKRAVVAAAASYCWVFLFIMNFMLCYDVAIIRAGARQGHLKLKFIHFILILFLVGSKHSMLSLTCCVYRGEWVGDRERERVVDVVSKQCICEEKTRAIGSAAGTPPARHRSAVYLGIGAAAFVDCAFIFCLYRPGCYAGCLVVQL